MNFDPMKRTVVGCLLAISLVATSFAAGEEAPPANAKSADPLYQKMLALDTAMFDSFNRCSDPAEFDKHAAFFVMYFEFYHD